MIIHYFRRCWVVLLAQETHAGLLRVFFCRLLADEEDCPVIPYAHVFNDYFYCLCWIHFEPRGPLSPARLSLLGACPRRPDNPYIHNWYHGVSVYGHLASRQYTASTLPWYGCVRPSGILSIHSLYLALHAPITQLVPCRGTSV